ILTLRELADVLVETLAQRAPALGHFLGRLADIDQIAIEVESINSALGWPNALFQLETRRRLQFFDDLRSDSPIQVELEVVRVVSVRHGERIVADSFPESN